MLSGTHLAVWGDPIAHSRSPELHAAAYGVLDRKWTYGRRQVDEASFPAELSGLDPSWRGLSLTFPLKQAAFRAADERDERARRTGAVNTLLLTEDGRVRGFNTDVGGLVRSLRESGVVAPTRARILGAGATATSALVALAELGTEDVEVIARRPEAVASLSALGDELGVAVRGETFASTGAAEVDVTVATLPGGTDVGPGIRPFAAAGGLLLDVVYGSWPTPLAEAWVAEGADAVSGLGMLLHQALLQVRIFVSGEVETPLPDEDRVLAAMRRALVGD